MARTSNDNKGPVLVGLDASGHSDEAAVVAFGLARALDLQVELVHAADIAPELWSHVDALGVASAREATLARISKALVAAGLAALEPSTRFDVVAGAPAAALVAQAEQRHARLIVLGRHRRHGGLDFGNTVRSVLAKARCPVWVQTGAPRAVRRILCAIDLSPASNAVLGLTRDLALALGAEVTVLHSFVRPELGFVLGYPVSFPPSVVDAARENAERDFRRLLEPFEWRGAVHRRAFVDGEPAAEICAAAEAADLVVMGTHGRSALARTLVGSVTANVLREARWPVIVMRCPE